MKLKIKVTKDILRRSVGCGTTLGQESPAHNCAIALAVRDILPSASVGTDSIKVYTNIVVPRCTLIFLPRVARNFIKEFDRLGANFPQSRLTLPELEFEVEIPEILINYINIEDLQRSETLELV